MADGTEVKGDALAPKEGQPRSDEQLPSATTDTIPKTEHEKAINEERRRQAGLNKTIDALTKERDTLKQSHGALAAQVTELQRRIDEAEEARYQDDPDGLAQFKKEKEKEQQYRQWEIEKKSHTELLKLAEKFGIKTPEDVEKFAADWESYQQEKADEDWVEVVFEAADAVGGDATKLKAKAEQYGITAGSDKADERLKSLAADLWPKKEEEPVIGDSGRTVGGGVDLSNLTPRERIEYGLTHSK